MNALDAAAVKTKRDEWACPCCGMPTDSSYCQPCAKAECGECDYRSAPVCMVELAAKGFAVVDTSVEPVQLRGGSIPTCRVEILRGPDGRHSYGRVLEVLS